MNNLIRPHPQLYQRLLPNFRTATLVPWSTKSRREEIYLKGSLRTRKQERSSERLPFKLSSFGTQKKWFKEKRQVLSGPIPVPSMCRARCQTAIPTRSPSCILRQKIKIQLPSKPGKEWGLSPLANKEKLHILRIQLLKIRNRQMAIMLQG